MKNLYSTEKGIKLPISKHIFYLFFLPSLVLIFLTTGLKYTQAGEQYSPCPQPRFTEKAPPNIYKLKNPLENSPENLKKGKLLFQVKAKPLPCKNCHGMLGDGSGAMARGFNPPPRNFTCAKTINGVTDGQLFWITKNGSPGTGMLSYKGLKDEKIWQIVLFLRELAK